MSGIFNIVMGVAAIALGLSGRFTLIGTNSGKWLIVAGLIIFFLGVYQVWKSNSRRSRRPRN